jgi:O-acetyl-ADP-ribose deacetylase (regulator of RNase III)
VSGAIKKRAGYQPFREVAKYGPIPLGVEALTSVCRLPSKGIIHVAGISMWWQASEYSIRESCRNAIRIAREQLFISIAFPLIGVGTGGGSVEKVQKLMIEQHCIKGYAGRIVVVRFQK